jgi:signal transduction histidine kinase
MKKTQGYHLLFGFTLLTLAVLGVRLAFVFMSSVESERTAKLNELLHATVVSALMLGIGDQPPEVGPLAGATIEGEPSLEVIPASEQTEGDLFAPAIPRYPHLGVRPDPDLVERIDRRLQRRRFMVFGESALLFALLGICSYMLYRLVRQERFATRRMEAFVSAVTHEMKTPLTGIKSLLETFAAGKVPEEKALKLYVMGLKEAERLEHTVENVLISGRLRTERYHTEPEPVELRSFLEGFLEHRRRYLVGRSESIRMEWEPEQPELEAMADPNALRIILENLTDNALKYGGPDPQVTIRVQTEGDRVLISLEDEGIGFEAEHAATLFEPFKRSLGGKPSTQHGSGLGLSICRALARHMGGDISAASDGPGLGSRFTVSLRGTMG